MVKWVIKQQHKETESAFSVSMGCCFQRDAIVTEMHYIDTQPLVN